MPKNTNSHGAWSRAKISTLSTILLIMMAGAGVFFTSAFGFLFSQIETALHDWNTIQSAFSLNSDSTAIQAFSSNLENLKNIILFFILAVLIAVGAFFILMYTTLIGKIVRPLKTLEKGILQITSTNDFSQTIPVKHQDEVGQVSQSFNGLTSDLKIIFDQINANLQNVAEGDFSQKCQVDVHGDLEILKENVNASIHSVGVTMTSLGEVSEAISAGDFSVRMNPEIQGEIKHKVDFAMQTMDTIIEQINDVMQNVMQADFSQRVEQPAKGKMHELTEYINTAVETLSSNIVQLNFAADALQQGNLTYQITTPFKGEFETLRHNLNLASEQLNDTLSSVIDSSQDVVTGVEQIAQGNQDLSDRTQSQAASLEQTASAMEQITAAVSQSADNSERAQKLAFEALTLSQDGRKEMANSVDSMHTIQTSSQRINDIVSLIDSIAFQTNLLALNAAVEAARAGDHGRGFAVVAGEVRSLATKSADAAKDISRLINEVVAQVNSGAERLDSTSQAFEQINQSVQTVNEIVTEISHSTKEQALGISQVNHAINQLDSGVQKNAVLVEETASGANALNDLSSSLSHSVTQFQVNKISSNNALEVSN